MGYFGTPNLVVYQLLSAFYFLFLLSTMGIFVPVCDLFRPSTRRNWLRRNVKQLAELGAVYWLTMVIMST